MAEDTLSSEFYWNYIYIKVENQLFCVPVCEFVKSSEVFADMFHLPSSPETPSEGQDKDHPLVLEGYKKDEFTCLLRVMYPTAGSVISDKKFELHLKKEEWVSVLKLSTRDMKKIRQYAIYKLSTDVILSPVEKMLLARAHRVSTWLTEAITSLTSIQNATPTLEYLSPLGWETAARILWIAQVNSRPSQSVAPGVLSFRRSNVKCASQACSSSLSSLINSDPVCGGCGRVVYAHSELTSSYASSPLHGTNDRSAQLLSLRCGRCGNRAFLGSYSCISCSKTFSGGSDVRITPNKTLKDMIEEVFGEEIKDYELSTTIA